MKTILVSVFLLLLAGCTTFNQENGLAELKEIELRYLGKGTIAPATITEIELMEKELSALSQKSSAPVKEMIGIRIDLLEFSSQYLEAEKSRRKISPIKGGCGETDSLKTTINRLENALAKKSPISARIRNFQAQQPSLYRQSNISLQDFEQFSGTLTAMKTEMQTFYEQACTT